MGVVSFTNRKVIAERARISTLHPVDAAREYIAHKRRRSEFIGPTNFEIDCIDVARQDARYKRAISNDVGALFLWSSK